MQKSELRLPKQQLELALVNIGPFWHPDGNSFELTQGPLDFPWNPEQMQLVLPDYFPSRKALSFAKVSELIRSATVERRCTSRVRSRLASSPKSSISRLKPLALMRSRRKGCKYFCLNLHIRLFLFCIFRLLIEDHIQHAVTRPDLIAVIQHIIT